LSAGDRRNGTSKHGHGGNPAGRPTGQYAGRPTGQYAGRHATTARKSARWARKAVPAAAIAASLAAGAAAYGFTSTAQANPDKLNAALSSPVILHAVTQADFGKADAAAAKLLSPRHKDHGAASPQASASPSHRGAKPSASATAKPAAAASSHAPAAAATTPAASPSASASSAATATTVSCSLTSSLLPENVTTIVNFLLAHGYSRNAAAGIAGNMYQESNGDPESVGSGGGGLIGFTPLPPGYVTGNPAADLQTQLAAVLAYNQGWASYLPALNSAATPAAAADIYVYDFERAGIPAASTREASAEAVASACNLLSAPGVRRPPESPRPQWGAFARPADISCPA
jgi:hypothetical protein